MVHPYLQAIADADISKSSKRLYVRHLIKLSKITGRTLEVLVQRPRSSYATIVQEYPNTSTRRTMVVAIKSIFKHVPSLQCDYPHAYKKWHEYFKQLDEDVSKRVLAGEPSERERRHWVHWTDVVAKERELASTAYASPDHLLLAMYVLIEPGRQDYNAVYILPRMPRDMTKGNFLVLPEDAALPATLVLNDYKTSKAYSTYQRELPTELTAIIRESLRQRPRKYLFCQENGEPYLRRNSFTKYSNRVLERLFLKKFTVSLMRHSYISEGIDFAQSPPGAIFSAAKHMHHSVAQQQLYRRKVEPEETEVILQQQHEPVQPETKHHHRPPRQKQQQQRHEFKPGGYIDISF